MANRRIRSSRALVIPSKGDLHRTNDQRLQVARNEASKRKPLSSLEHSKPNLTKIVHFVQRQAKPQDDKMGRTNKQRLNAGGDESWAKEIERYDMMKSHERLVREGFHHKVSSKTTLEVEKAWASMAKSAMIKPTREEFAARYQCNSHQNERIDTGKRRTNAMLLLLSQGKYTDVETCLDSNAGRGENMLAKILNTVDIGGQISTLMFVDGWKAVLNAAITASDSWMAIANSAKIWDFLAANLRTDGHSGVFIVVNPEYTVGELNMSNDLDPFGLDATNALSTWTQEAMRLEREIYLSIHFLHGRISRKNGRNRAAKQRSEVKKLIPIDFLATDIVSAIKNIPDSARLWGSSQFISGLRSQLYEPPAILCTGRLRSMLKHISEQRNVLQVLYFQNVPFLDRRMIAVILRACPNVRMVGIYSCPLMHFGDVLCLLDLVHEVNHRRRQERHPEITALDYFPRYHQGMPYETTNSATYGLTWGPHKLDIVQRGFFNIILKAFLKSKRMKINLLFDKDKEFCKYLHMVPNYPLAVPAFLDAMHRYLDVRDETVRRQILYDILKPVRVGLQKDMEHDWPYWYTNIMGRMLVFCSSCGYETFEDFYSAAARQMQPHKRVCAGCTLQRWLDEEDDHLKIHKKEILDTLYPKWNGIDFNDDAPLLQTAKKLIKIRSKSSVRRPIPDMTIDSGGVMSSRPVMMELVRDNKMHWDSLQNLPSLTELLTGPKSVQVWGEVYNKCNNLDVYCRAVRRVKEESEQKPKETISFICSRPDGGMPDHAEEWQPRKEVREGIRSHDFESATHLFAGLCSKGWAGY